MGKAEKEKLEQDDEASERCDADSAEESDEAEYWEPHDDDRLQMDGRPVPVNSPSLWAKMTPEDHYRRLMNSDDEDIEAWEHLGDLVWAYLGSGKNKERIYKILQAGGRTYEDMVHSIMTHILKKIREGKLHLSETGKFYGLLKVIIVNCLCDVLRKPLVEYDLADLGGEEGAILPGTTTPEETVEKKLLMDLIWRAIAEKAPISNPNHRRALDLSLRMEMGTVSITNNQELAERLSIELGEPVTYVQASSWIATGKQQLREYLSNQTKEKKK